MIEHNEAWEFVPANPDRRIPLAHWLWFCGALGVGIALVWWLG